MRKKHDEMHAVRTTDRAVTAFYSRVIVVLHISSGYREEILLVIGYHLTSVSVRWRVCE